MIEFGGAERSDSAGIYLDHHATTPCDRRVVAAMLPLFGHQPSGETNGETDGTGFGNPSSTQHAWGRRAAERVEVARAQVASAVAAEPEEVVFTSGATEADNLALLGASGARSRNLPAGSTAHVITQVTEHKAVLDACAVLESRGLDGRRVRISYLPVEPDGRLDPGRVEREISSDTVLVSVMVANNEIGVVQPLAEIAEICTRSGVWLHSDGAQALAHGDCHRDRLGWDLLSLSSHKAYGPPGIGALVVRRRRPRVRLDPQMHGGGHERGRRSGTLAVPLIVGFAKACELAAEDPQADRLARLRDRLLDGLRRAFPDLEVNGSRVHRLPHNLNVSLPDMHAETLMAELDGLAISSGSACTSSAGSSSHVLAALAALPGRDRQQRAEQALRFGLGRGTTEEQVDRAVAELVRAAGVVARRSSRPATEVASCAPALGVCG